VAYVSAVSVPANNAEQSGKWRMVGAPFTVAFSQNRQFVSW